MKDRRWLFPLAALGVVVIVAVVLAVVILSSRNSNNSGTATSAHHATTTQAIRATSTTASTTTSTTASTTTSTTAPLPATSSVVVDVLNASGATGLAAQTAAGLRQDGFGVSGIGNASSNIAPGGPSQIYYGPDGLPAAHTLAASLNGPVTYIANSMLGGNNLILWIANAQLTVTTTTS
jgi:LytR cell envelope-related transcriptional attenuator